MLEQDPKQSQAREDLSRFLSACYYEPSDAFAQEHLFDSMVNAAQLLDPQLEEGARKLGQAYASQEIQTLLVDYTRLFVGPMQPLAQPYGSSWLGSDAASKQSSIDGVLELYRLGGFEIDDELRELPDHVAIELEFFYLLQFTKNQASRSDRTDELAAAKQLERRFLNEHLRVWLAPFTAAVTSNAETDFYRELAVFTARFLGHEA
jgi:TorA maturation chaperone TorD